MVSAIGSTINDLCRHRMVIRVKCARCDRKALVWPNKIRTDRNARKDFRQLRYTCACGDVAAGAYALPKDWLTPDDLRDEKSPDA